MTYTETIKQGAAAVRRTAQKNILEVLVTIKEEDPTAGNEILFRKWSAAMKEDEDYLEAVLRHSFTNLNSSLEPRKQHSRSSPRNRTREQLKADCAPYLAAVVRMKMADFIWPNGKTTRENTFGYIAAASGGSTRLAKAGKPNQIIGKVLTDEQIQKLWEAKGVI